MFLQPSITNKRYPLRNHQSRNQNQNQSQNLASSSSSSLGSSYNGCTKFDIALRFQQAVARQEANRTELNWIQTQLITTFTFSKSPLSTTNNTTIQMMIVLLFKVKNHHSTITGWILLLPEMSIITSIDSENYIRERDFCMFVWIDVNRTARKQSFLIKQFSDGKLCERSQYTSSGGWFDG